jgi:hypothetical protein
MIVFFVRVHPHLKISGRKEKGDVQITAAITVAGPEMNNKNMHKHEIEVAYSAAQVDGVAPKILVRTTLFLHRFRPYN